MKKTCPNKNLLSIRNNGFAHPLLLLIALILILSLVGFRLYKDTRQREAIQKSLGAQTYTQDNLNVVKGLLKFQYNNYSAFNRTLTRSVVGSIDSNELRAAYNNAYSTYLYGVAANDESIRQEGLQMTKNLIDQIGMNKPAKGFGWPLTLEAMTKTYVFTKSELDSTRSNKLVAEINRYAKEMMVDRNSLKISHVKGFSFVSGRVMNSSLRTTANVTVYNKTELKDVVFGNGAPNNVTKVSITVFDDGKNPARNAALVLSNNPESWKNRSRTLVFYMSPDPSKSFVRLDNFDSSGKPTRVDYPFKSGLHVGWNQLEIATDGSYIEFRHDSKIEQIQQAYANFKDLKYVAFGTVGTSPHVTNFGNLQFDGEEFTAYDRFGTSNGFVYSLSDAAANSVVTDKMTPLNSPSGGYRENTAAEANAWTASGLAWYSLHVPNAKNYIPQSKCFAYHAITTSRDSAYCGLKTQTVFDNTYKLENHRRLAGHPGYAAATLVSLASGQQAFQLANKAIPAEFSHNTENLYKWMMGELEYPNDISKSIKFGSLVKWPDWFFVSDTLARGALYLDVTGKSDSLNLLLKKYQEQFPGIVSHPTSEKDAYIYNGVMTGEVLAPMLIDDLSCPVVQIISVANACTSTGYTSTLNWQGIAGAKKYYIAYDDDTNFWQAETGETSRVVSSTTTTWTSPVFQTKKPRYFAVRVADSTSCIPHPAAFGSQKMDAGTCNSPSNIVIRAKGVKHNNVWPKLQFHAKNSSNVYQLLTTFNVESPEYQDYLFTHTAKISPSQVKLQFINDSGPRDVYVDYILVDGVKYETEAASTYSTGSWINSTAKCSPGYPSSERLSCNGYFEYQKR